MIDLAQAPKQADEGSTSRASLVIDEAFSLRALQAVKAGDDLIVMTWLDLRGPHRFCATTRAATASRARRGRLHHAVAAPAQSAAACIR